MRKTLTDASIRALKPRETRYAERDPQLPAHYVRVAPNGEKAFYAVARNPKTGKQAWTRIGACDLMKIDEARARARSVIQRVKDGLPAIEPAKDAFAAIAAEWMKRHVEKKGLRTGDEYQRVLDRYILPSWADVEFTSIRRSDVTALLDRIEDENGARQADYALATIRVIMNWFESRNDDYRSPVAKGMKRVSAKAAARERILSDHEIGAVWAAAEGPFGAIVKTCLLTAQRLDKVSRMKHVDVVEGVWTIDTAEREKGNAVELTLPKMALSIIEVQPRFESNPYVFVGRGRRYFNGFSKAKAALDRRSGVTGWRTHDLRRTARSLMSRTGVSENDAERVMGHARDFIVENYDLHAYTDEKRVALAKLAALIDSIVHPRDNVLPMAERAKAPTRQV